MTWSVVSAIGVLALGLAALVLAADAAVETSVSIARRFRVSPILTGLVLVSLGTDLPEIVNSVVSASAGHANIGLGDALGSYLTQFTLALGRLRLLSRSFKVSRKEILVTGICAILGLVFAISMAEKGFFTRVNAIALVASWPAFIILIRSALQDRMAVAPPGRASETDSLARQTGVLLASFAGVAIGSYAVVESVLQIASGFSVSEYLVSFFAVAIGTSLPEFVVDLSAIRKGHVELAIGDIIGSCLVDATAAVGMGPPVLPAGGIGRAGAWNRHICCIGRNSRGGVAGYPAKAGQKGRAHPRVHLLAHVSVAAVAVEKAGCGLITEQGLCDRLRARVRSGETGASNRHARNGPGTVASSPRPVPGGEHTRADGV